MFQSLTKIDVAAVSPRTSDALSELTWISRIPIPKAGGNPRETAGPVFD